MTTFALDPLGKRSWTCAGPPWAHSTTWKHAWVCNLRQLTYTPAYPNQPVAADQLSGASGAPLQSFSTLVSQTFSAGIKVPYWNMSAAGRPFFADPVGVQVGNGPYTVIVAGRVITLPGATLQGSIFAFANTASNVPYGTLSVTPTNAIAATRHNGTSQKTLGGFIGDQNPHVWTVQYNGVSSFLRQDMVTMASGDLGTAGTAYNTFALGAQRGNIFYNADSIQGYVGAVVAPSAVSLTEIQAAERLFARYLKIF